MSEFFKVWELIFFEGMLRGCWSVGFLDLANRQQKLSPERYTFRWEQNFLEIFTFNCFLFIFKIFFVLFFTKAPISAMSDDQFDREDRDYRPLQVSFQKKKFF